MIYELSAPPNKKQLNNCLTKVTLLKNEAGEISETNFDPIHKSVGN